MKDVICGIAIEEMWKEMEIEIGLWDSWMDNLSYE